MISIICLWTWFRTRLFLCESRDVLLLPFTAGGCVVAVVVVAVVAVATAGAVVVVAGVVVAAVVVVNEMLVAPFLYTM